MKITQRQNVVKTVKAPFYTVNIVQRHHKQMSPSDHKGGNNLCKCVSTKTEHYERDKGNTHTCCSGSSMKLEPVSLLSIFIGFISSFISSNV